MYLLHKISTKPKLRESCFFTKARFLLYPKKEFCYSTYLARFSRERGGGGGLFHCVVCFVVVVVLLVLLFHHCLLCRGVVVVSLWYCCCCRVVVVVVVLCCFIVVCVVLLLLFVWFCCCCFVVVYCCGFIVVYCCGFVVVLYSLWSEIIATLISATGGNFSAIHVDYVDFVPESGWRFRSRNLEMNIKINFLSKKIKYKINCLSKINK